jgi:hypothetical protein
MLHSAHSSEYVLYVNGADTKSQKKVSRSSAVREGRGGGSSAAAPTLADVNCGLNFLAERLPRAKGRQ